MFNKIASLFKVEIDHKQLQKEMEYNNYKLSLLKENLFELDKKIKLKPGNLNLLLIKYYLGELECEIKAEQNALKEKINKR